MSEVSCSFSSTYRFDVYGIFAERRNIQSAAPMAVLPSAEDEAGHLFMPVLKGGGGEGGGVWKVEMQEWGFMHAQVKVYLGSV